ncbi:MAG: hypothetical protein HY319_10245 [Armatimonadetes bacterium]|nr:hypothetical protein [Armatimonadota bacterium]
MVFAGPETTLSRKMAQYRGILEKAPDDLTPVLAFAETAMRRGLRLEALEAYQKVLGQESSIPEAHLAMAEIYHQQGLVSEAYQELVQLFALEPYNAEGHLLARRMAGSTEPPDLARPYLEEGSTLDEVARARTRLSISRSILMREVQELSRIAATNREPILEYFLAEAQKRLDRIHEALSELETLEEEARAPRLRPPMVPPEVAEEAILESPEEDFPVTGAPPLEELEPAPRAPLWPESLEDLVSEETTYSLIHEPPPALEPIEPAPLPLDLDQFTRELEAEPSPVPPPPLEPGLGWEQGLKAPPGFEVPPPIQAPPPLQPTDLEAELSLSAASLSVGGLELGLPPTYEDSAPSPAPVSAPWLSELVFPEATLEGPPSSARLSFYDSLQAPLSTLTGQLAKTRGVTSLFICSREGHVIQHSTRDAMTPDLVSNLVVDGLSFLESYASEPRYWVLECDGGIVVLQMIDPRHVLVAVGQAGANFGALRYTMDKICPKFAELLSAAPQ